LIALWMAIFGKLTTILHVKIGPSLRIVD